MLLSVSLAVVAMLSTGEPAASFGQFAYGDTHRLAFFEVSPTEFTFLRNHGARIQFSEPTDFFPQRLSRFDKVLTYRPRPGAPLRLRFEATSLGFSLQYRDGFRLKGRGTSAPYLTWAEGSVGPGVPTPATGWALLSWSEPLPPVLLVFSGEPVALQVSEQADGWALETQTPYDGWVMVRAPLGGEAVITRGAADLGRLVARVKDKVATMGEAPRLTDVEASADDRGVTVTWRFDRPGAFVPPPATGGANERRLKLLSPIERVGTGESFRCSSNELTIRFIGRGLHPGRGVVVGQVAEEEFPLDQPRHIAEAALACVWNTLSARGETELRRFLGVWASYAGVDREPATGLPWPGGRERDALAEYAALCLAERALGMSAERPTALFASLDWLTWLPTGDAEQAREAAAYLALLGALSQDAYERALGAMAQAALRVEQAEQPFDSLRDEVYPIAAVLDLAPPRRLLPALSPIRVLSHGTTVSCRDGEISFEGLVTKVEPFDVRLLGATVVPQVSAKFNLDAPEMTVRGSVVAVRLTPRRVGYWKLSVRVSEATFRALPSAMPSPRCNEGRRSLSAPAPALR